MNTYVADWLSTVAGWEWSAVNFRGEPEPMFRIKDSDVFSTQPRRQGPVDPRFDPCGWNRCDPA